MSDNILSAVLTFSLLAGGTAAFGSEMFRTPQPAKASAPVVVLPAVTITAQRIAPMQVVTLPPVTVTARRIAPMQVVTLPPVTVVGRREAVTVAVETRASETPRIQ